MLKIGEFAQIAQISVRMLRHYDKLGLLKPGYIDRSSGYRYYSLDQLPRLYRLLALKDLGLSLEQVTRLLDEHLSTSELRGMLRLKQAELRQEIDETTCRLERVEQRLVHLEQQGDQPPYDVVMKSLPSTPALTCYRTLPPLTAEGFSAVFYEGADAVEQAGLAYQSIFALSYNPYPVFKRAFDDQWPYRFEAVFTLSKPDAPPIALKDGFWLKPRQIPACEQVISALHLGSDQTRPQAHRTLCAWMEQHGYTLDGPVRDIFLRRSQDDHHLTEIQYPIRKVETIQDTDEHLEKEI